MNENPTSENSSIENPSRRRFIAKAAYVAPLILTLKATPAYAARGSGPGPGGGGCGRRGRGRGRGRCGSDCGNGQGQQSGTSSSWFSRVIVFLSG